MAYKVVNALETQQLHLTHHTRPRAPLGVPASDVWRAVGGGDPVSSPRPALVSLVDEGLMSHTSNITRIISSQTRGDSQFAKRPSFPSARLSVGGPTLSRLPPSPPAAPSRRSAPSRKGRSRASSLRRSLWVESSCFPVCAHTTHTAPRAFPFPCAAALYLFHL
jgi:hypothetical protein